MVSVDTSGSSVRSMGGTAERGWEEEYATKIKQKTQTSWTWKKHIHVHCRGIEKPLCFHSVAAKNGPEIANQEISQDALQERAGIAVLGHGNVARSKSLEMYSKINMLFQATRLLEKNLFDASVFQH